MQNPNAKNPPSGTVTFLFTDIEKSTQLWERHNEQMRPVLARHDALLRSAVEAHGGWIVKTTGDGIHAVFPTTAGALTAALAAQRRLRDTDWSEIAPDKVRVRMGLHTGEAELRDGDYYGTAVNLSARIMALGHGGQLLLSAATALLLQVQLPEQTSLRDLGSVRIRGLQNPERIFQVVTPDLQSDFPPLKATQEKIGNLPAHVSSFIGRIREMAEIRATLGDTRLLTLVGPGGTGKSRISIQIANDVQADYEHGAWLVELAPVADPQLVTSTVAAIFGLQAQASGQVMEMLIDFLEEKELLLILDNCEHLIEASAQLAAELIRTCPRLTILASSREGLGIYGERTYHLPTLSLPPLSDGTTAAVKQSEAVQLFIERATAAQQGFQLNEANAQAVVEVTRRLDGIPLAIELAAARLNVFTVEQVASRLDQRFRLLTGGSRTALPRQQTLRALIDWSYDLLDEKERRLFRLLSVFKGGWTFDAAEFIADPLDVYFLLPQLIGKSLVTRGTESSSENGHNSADDIRPRYTYLETIRQYALDRLIEAWEVEEARDRHFAYYMQLSNSSIFGSGAPVDKPLENDIIPEHDNIRSAVEWGTDRYPVRTVTLLWNFMFYLSDQLPGTESIAWTTAVVKVLENTKPGAEISALEIENARLKGLVILCFLKLFMGQLDEAFQLAEKIIPELSAPGIDPILLPDAYFVRAQAALFLEKPEFDESVVRAEELLRQIDKNPLRDWMLAILLMLAVALEDRRGRPDLAMQRFNESNQLMKDLDRGLVPWVEFSRLLVIMEMDIDPQEKQAQYKKSLELFEKTHSKRMVAMVASYWGHQQRHEGHNTQALEIYRKMFSQWRDLGHRAAMANILENIAFIDRLQDRPQRAIKLLGAAERIRQEIGQDMLPPEREEYKRELAALKTAVTPDQFNNLWLEGSTLSNDSLITLIASP